jgi:hypothetical protein
LLVRPAAYPRGKNTEAAVILANIRLGFESLSGTNALAYLVSSVIEDEKFCNIVHRCQYLKKFFIIDPVAKKLVFVIIFGQIYHDDKAWPTYVEVFTLPANGKEATVNRVLDGSTYPG